jgi:hypothetical protein
VKPPQTLRVRPLLAACVLLALAPLGIALAVTPEIDPDQLEGRVVAALEDADLETDYAETLAAGLQLLKLSRLNAEELDRRVQDTRARDDQDVVLLTCLLDKQEQLEKVLRKAQTRMDSVLDVGAEGGDLSTSLVVLAVYSQKIQLIAQEAAACTASGEEPASGLDGITPPERPGDFDFDPHGEPGIPGVPGVGGDGTAQPPFAVPPPIASPIR